MPQEGSGRPTGLKRLGALGQWLLGNRLYLYIFLGLLLVLLVVIYLLLRPEKPQLPSVPQGGWARGLVSYWAFDEKTGQLAYEAKAKTHNGRLGTSHGGDSSDPQRSRKGKIGRALKFDGQDDYLVVIDHPALRIDKEITLEGWFKVLGSSSPSPEPVWLKHYKYRRQLIVDNTKSKESFENFQLLITFDSSSLISQAKMQRNCQDLRFTDADETTPLFYWVESGCGTEETKVWVRVPQLPGRLTKNLYLYYGNAEASSESDFYKTMETPPTEWWRYPLPKDEEREGKELKGLAIDSQDRIMAVGSDKEERDLQWRLDQISPRGRGVKGYATDPSAGADVINAAVFDAEDILILGGFDFKPGNSQWRAEKREMNKGWVFEQNFSPGADEIRAVATDRENNVLLAGFDSVPGNPQWRLVKLNAAGEFLWDYTLDPSEQADVIVDVKADSRNNIILAGYEKSLKNDRWRIEKLDPEGELLYSYRLDVSDGADVLNSIALDSQDNVIAVGYDFFPGDAQWRVVKLDQEGKRLWQWNFNPSPGFDELKAVGVDSEDNIVIAGYDSSPGDFRWAMQKFSPEGDKIWEWSKNLSPGFDELKAMAVDSENNIILAGHDFSLKYDPQWRVIKFSERKPVFPQPSVTIEEERLARPLSPNLILGKADSYQVSATPDKIIGLINRASISSPLRSEDWQHFALTYDGLRQKLYLNAVLVNNRALSGEITTNLNNLFIGYNFTGLIDELKVYNRALPPDEVRALYERR